MPYQQPDRWGVQIAKEPSSRCYARLDAGLRGDSPRADRLDACSAWKASPSVLHRQSGRQAMRAIHPSASSLPLDSRRSRLRDRRGTMCLAERLVPLRRDSPRRPLAVATSSPPLTWALATGSPGVERPLAAGPRRRRPSTPGRRWGGRSARPGLRALGRAHLGLVPGLNGPSSHCAVAPWDGRGPRRPWGRRKPRARRRARPAGSALGRCAPNARLDARLSACR